MHRRAAAVAVEGGAIVALDLKLPLFYFVTLAVGVIAADDAVSAFVDEVAHHGGATNRAAALGAQGSDFADGAGVFVVGIGGHGFFTRAEIHGVGATILGFLVIARAAQEDTGLTGANGHVATAFIANDIGGHRIVGAHIRVGFIQGGGEFFVETVKHRFPIGLTGGNVV